MVFLQNRNGVVFKSDGRGAGGCFFSGRASAIWVIQLGSAPLSESFFKGRGREELLSLKNIST